MEYCYIAPKDDELKHYGVKGMHWGIRRYQPYPDGEHGQFLKKRQAKKLVKAMNENSYTYANAKYMRNKSLDRATKYAHKAEVANAKGKLKKTNKLMNKANQELSDAKFHKNTMEQAVNEVNKAIKILDKGGYGVSSKSKNKMLIDRGKMMTGQLLFGPIGQIAMAPRGQVRKYKAEEHPRFGMDDNNRLYAKNKQAKKVWNDVHKHGGRLDLQTNKKTGDLIPKHTVTDKSGNVNLSKNPSGLNVMVTAAEAKKLGLNESTRITGKQESEMWKAIGKQMEKEMKKKKR